MSIIQIGVIGVVGALLAIQFKSVRKEYSTYISMVVGLLISSFIFFTTHFLPHSILLIFLQELSLITDSQ